VCGDIPNRSESLPAQIHLVVGNDSMALLERHCDLERVDRIQPQTLAEQRCARVDIVRGDVFWHDRFDDDLLDFRFQTLERTQIRLPQGTNRATLR
jgi:hypothetical protein